MAVSSAALHVQSPLNLVLPVKPARLMKLLLRLQELDERRDNPLRAALTGLGNVHFAQFVLLGDGTHLGVFTIFDGSFDDYILSFTDHIGDIFNSILEHIDDDAEALIPVQQHRDEFLQFIRKHDLRGLGLFSAYPNRRLFDIQDALAETHR